MYTSMSTRALTLLRNSLCFPRFLSNPFLITSDLDFPFQTPIGPLCLFFSHSTNFFWPSKPQAFLYPHPLVLFLLPGFNSLRWLLIQSSASHDYPTLDFPSSMLHFFSISFSYCCCNNLLQIFGLEQDVLIIL